MCRYTPFHLSHYLFSSHPFKFETSGTSFTDFTHCFQRAIHRSSTVEFLEHGKVKPVVSFAGLFWYPRLGRETSLFPHVNNGKSDVSHPNRGYQNRPLKNRWKSAQMEENDGIPNSLKADWKGRVVISGPRCEASGKTIVLPSLGLRDEGRSC
ncbi:hypothetical protein AVEN_275000-1 [Araneus ventricosus]|uniref:Uncharacterized protein n=1 Tax=Araneus ventricosus TaxID=182803 RepID=A0A4Y2X155_ARAVE|nr:hypothetical protein AVEN_275000-1 [Araneus ventricosus]